MSDVIIFERMQQRRGTAADLAVVNEVLRDGEKCYETDTGFWKTGDGLTSYNSLPYDNASRVPYDNATSGLTATDVQAAVDELAVKVASGTVNPTSPYPNQRFWREDIHQLIYYDAVGLQWLTVQQFPLELPAGDGNPSITVSGQRTGRGAVRQDLHLYLSRWDCNTFVVGTNNGSNYWTVDLSWINAANAATSLASFNTSADTVANNVVHAPALGVVLPSTAKVLAVTGTKTGTPGALYAFGPLAYRLVVP